MYTTPGLFATWRRLWHVAAVVAAAWAVIGALLFLVFARPATGQVIDPDRCWTCQDKREHFLSGAVLDVAVRGPWIARPWRDRAWKRVGLVCLIGAGYETAQVLTAHGNLGKPGYGFSPIDLAADCGGAAAMEGAIALAGKMPDWFAMAATSALIVADWGQTLDFRAKGYREANPIMGPHPSRGQVNAAIGAGLAANLAVRALPKKVRKGVWGAVLFREAVAVAGNASLPNAGLSFSF